MRPDVEEYIRAQGWIPVGAPPTNNKREWISKDGKQKATEEYLENLALELIDNPNEAPIELGGKQVYVRYTSIDTPCHMCAFFREDCLNIDCKKYDKPGRHAFFVEVASRISWVLFFEALTKSTTEREALIIKDAFKTHFGQAPDVNTPIEIKRIKPAPQGSVESLAYCFRGETFLFKHTSEWTVAKVSDTHYVVEQRTFYQKG